MSGNRKNEPELRCLIDFGSVLLGAMRWDRKPSCMAEIAETQEEKLYGRKKINGLQGEHKGLCSGA